MDGNSKGAELPMTHPRATATSRRSQCPDDTDLPRRNFPLIPPCPTVHGRAAFPNGPRPNHGIIQTGLMKSDEIRWTAAPGRVPCLQSRGPRAASTASLAKHAAVCRPRPFPGLFNFILFEYPSWPARVNARLQMADGQPAVPANAANSDVVDTGGTSSSS